MKTYLRTTVFAFVLLHVVLLILVSLLFLAKWMGLEDLIFGPFQGLDLLGLLLFYAALIISAFALTALILWLRIRSVRMVTVALLSAVLIQQVLAALFAPALFQTLDYKLALGLQGMSADQVTAQVEDAQRKRQAFQESVRVGPVRYTLSCQAEQAYLPDQYRPAYEKARFVVPLEVTEPGRYRIKLEYTSDLNDRRRQVTKTGLYDLTAGQHDLNFEYTFGQLWGYFVETPGSSIEVRVDKLTSISDIFGANSTALVEDADKQQFRYVLSQVYRLDGLANVFTNSVGSLACPEVPVSTPPPADGP
jgi:hypothetical protein